MKKLKIDWSELISAFANNSYDLTYYLDTKTGKVFYITEDSLRSLEVIYSQYRDEESSDKFDLAAVLPETDLQDWEQQELQEAYQIMSDTESRYLEVPRRDSHDEYILMRDFISTVKNERAADLLQEAINMRQPFRRFKDVLHDYPHERERWFEYQEARHIEDIVEWLDEEDIEPANMEG